MRAKNGFNTKPLRCKTILANSMFTKSPLHHQNHPRFMIKAKSLPGTILL